MLIYFEFFGLSNFEILLQVIAVWENQKKEEYKEQSGKNIASSHPKEGGLF